MTLCVCDTVCSNDHKESGEEAKSSHWSLQMEQMLLGKPGVGTRCMDPNVHTIEYAAAVFMFM